MTGSSVALFLFVLRTSLQASLLAVLVLSLHFMVRRWTRWKLSSRALHLLWLVVLARLLIPGSWNAPWGFSLGGPGTSAPIQGVVIPVETTARNAPPTFSTNQSRKTGQLDAVSTLVGDNFGMEPDPTAVTPMSPPKPQPLLNEGPLQRHVEHPARSQNPGKEAVSLSVAGWIRWPSFNLLLNVATLCWLSGVALCAAWILRQWGRAMCLWRRTPTMSKGPERDLLTRCQQELGIRRRVILKLTDRLASPAVFGYWRPCILLPELSLKLTAEELRLVFIHELTHVRRGDVGLNWCVVAAGAVHWFNPLLKRAFASMQRVRELACDESVLAWLKPAERATYARTVLRVIELSQQQNVPQPALLVGLAGLFNHQDPVAQLDERIRMITTNSRSTFLRRWLLPALCLLALGWMGFTQAQEPVPPKVEAPPADLAPPAAGATAAGDKSPGTTPPPKDATRALPPQIVQVRDATAKLTVVQRQGKLVIAKDDIVRTAIADPSIVDIVQVTPKEISVIGKTLGSTTVTLWFDSDDPALVYLVEVVRDGSIAAASSKPGELRQYAVSDLLETFAKAFETPNKGDEQLREWAAAIADDRTPQERAKNSTAVENLPGKGAVLPAPLPPIPASGPDLTWRGLAAEFRLEKAGVSGTAEVAFIAKGVLQVRASPVGHGRLATALESVRQYGLHDFVVETQVLQIMDQEFRSLPVEWNYSSVVDAETQQPEGGFDRLSDQATGAFVGASVTRTQQRTVMTQTLDEAQVAEMRKSLKDKSVLAPKITLVEGQTAQVQSVVTRPFVVGIQGDKAQIRTYDDGWKIDLQPAISQTGGLRLQGKFARTEITRVDTTKIIRGGREVTLQVPEIETTQMTLVSGLSSGQTLAIAIPGLTPGPGQPKNAAKALVQLVLCQVKSRSLPVDRSQEYSVRNYPVADLVVPIPKTLKVEPGPGQPENIAAAKANFDPLIEILTSRIQPGSWEEHLTWKSRLYAVDAPPGTPENTKILLALDKPTTVKFIDTPLYECFTELAKQHEIAIVPKKAELEAMKLSSGIINLELSGISLRSVLKLLLEEIQCAYVIEDGMLIIGPKSIRVNSKSTRLEVMRPSPDDLALIQALNKNSSVNFVKEPWHQCLSQLARSSHFHLNTNNELLKSAGVDVMLPIDLQVDDVPVRVVLQRLLQPQRCDYAIENGMLVIHPRTGNGRFGSIVPFENTLSLVIRQTPQVHEEIAELLTELRKLQGRSVQLDLEVLQIPDKLLQKFGMTEESSTLERKDFEQLRDAFKKSMSTVTAPRITLFNGKTAEFKSTGQHGEELRWLVGTAIREQDQSVRVTLAVNATEAADALASSWTAALTPGKCMLVDATSRLLSVQIPGVPNVPAQNPLLFGKFADRPTTRTLVLITPRILKDEESEVQGEAKVDQAWEQLGLRLTPVTLPREAGIDFRGGLRVNEVRPESPAAGANVRKGDVLVGLHTYETISMENVDYVLNILSDISDHPVKFWVIRDKKTLPGVMHVKVPVGRSSNDVSGSEDSAHDSVAPAKLPPAKSAIEQTAYTATDAVEHPAPPAARSGPNPFKHDKDNCTWLRGVVTKTEAGEWQMQYSEDSKVDVHGGVLVLEGDDDTLEELQSGGVALIKGKIERKADSARGVIYRVTEVTLLKPHRRKP